MQSKEFFVIFENLNLITGVNTHCQCSMLNAHCHRCENLESISKTTWSTNRKSTLTL